MAVRFDAAADRLLRTSNLINYNGNYTIMGLVYLISTDNTCTVFSLNDNGLSNIDWMYYYPGTGLMRVNSNGNPAGSYAATWDTWYHVAMVRSAVNNLTSYINGVADGTSTYDVTGRNANTRLEVGGCTSGNQYAINGRVSFIKAWSVALTQAEIQTEMHTIRPQRTANLYGFWPCFPGATERLTDYSGNGYNWTAGGTLADEDPPPVSWGACISNFGWTAAELAGFLYKRHENTLLRM